VDEKRGAARLPQQQQHVRRNLVLNRRTADGTKGALTVLGLFYPLQKTGMI